MTAVVTLWLLELALKLTSLDLKRLVELLHPTFNPPADQTSVYLVMYNVYMKYSIKPPAHPKSPKWKPRILLQMLISDDHRPPGPPSPMPVASELFLSVRNHHPLENSPTLSVAIGSRD